MLQMKKELVRILPGKIERGYIFYDPVPQQSFELDLGVREQFLPSKDTNET